MKFYGKLGKPNLILEGNGYYISYNPLISDCVYDKILVKLGEADSRSGKDETALYRRDNDTWYVLNGDFRKEYEETTNLEEAMKVYYKNIKHRSGFSTD